MDMPLRGCCTDSPGSPDIETARQIYGTLAIILGSAALLLLAIEIFLH